jgi:ATP-dependent exoDNAse (exonuclease V) beta subunit
VRAADRRGLDLAFTGHILAIRDRPGVGLGDIAVLAHSRAEIDHCKRALRTAGIPHVDLLDYDGVTSNRVKVGTFKRAKGLEFKHVLLPGLREGPVPPYPGESDDAYRERAERMRRELYVGMTRARDGLWLGYVDD